MRAALALCLLCAACRTAVYEPELPRQAAPGGPPFRLSEVRVVRRPGADGKALLPSTTLSVSIEGARLDEVNAVFLNSAYSDACQGYITSPSLVEGKLVASWVVSDGSMFWGPTSVDLRLSEGEPEAACSRLPLANDGPEGALVLRGRREWFLTSRVYLEGNSGDVMPAVFGFSLGVGSWVGPLKLSLATGIASATCDFAVCKGATPENPQSGLTLPVDLEAEGFVVARHTSAFSLGVRPGLRLAWFEQANAPRRRAAFTPALVLKYWETNEIPLGSFGKPRRKEGSGAALEVPLGLWQDLDGSQPLGWYTGLSVSIAVPVD